MEEKTYRANTKAGGALERKLKKLKYKNRSILYSPDRTTHRFFVKPGHQQIHINTKTGQIRIINRQGYVVYRGVAIKDKQL